MFEALEKRTNILCVAVFISLVLLGKLFGAALYGLVPLSFCVVAGIFLWMKEVVRQGRKLEWSSERDRGKMVGFLRRHNKSALTNKYSQQQI